VLEWGKRSMKTLQILVSGRIAKGVDEELGIEDVFAGARVTDRDPAR
jgi:hypothetical protein